MDQLQILVICVTKGIENLFRPFENYEGTETLSSRRRCVFYPRIHGLGKESRLTQSSPESSSTYSSEREVDQVDVHRSWFLCTRVHDTPMTHVSFSLFSQTCIFVHSVLSRTHWVLSFFGSRVVRTTDRRKRKDYDPKGPRCKTKT